MTKTVSAIVPVLVLLACGLLAAAAPPADFPEKTVDLGRATVYKNVVYGPYAPEALVLNAFILKSQRPSPVFVQINSGGWRSNPMRIPDGKEGLLIERYREYFDAGFSVVQVSHRSVIREDVHWPDPMEDIARAVQYIRHKADAWNIDPKRISLSGRSSGSHVAEMVAYTPDRADPTSTDPVLRQSSRIACVIAYAGTADLAHHFSMCLKTGPDGKPAVTRDYMAKKIHELFGLGPEHVGTVEMEEHFRAMSPTSHLHSDCPPTLLVHRGPPDAASKDDPRLEWNVHTPINGFILAERLRELGVRCQLVLRDGPDPDRTQREIAFLKEFGGVVRD